jgi:hypothetical protein
LGSPVSSTNKTDHLDKAEILLKVALNTIIPYNSNHLLFGQVFGVECSTSESNTIFRNYIVDRTGKALKAA